MKSAVVLPRIHADRVVMSKLNFVFAASQVLRSLFHSKGNVVPYMSDKQQQNTVYMYKRLAVKERAIRTNTTGMI